jgi:transposase
VVVRESKTESTAEAIAGELSKEPSCRRIVLRLGVWRRSCFTGCADSVSRWSASGADKPSRALKALATHKTDRNDARGLAHLAHTGFKPVHVKSLQAHALRSLIIAQEVGWPAGDLGKPN